VLIGLWSKCANKFLDLGVCCQNNLRFPTLLRLFLTQFELGVPSLAKLQVQNDSL
jgi:hypothetical protein